MFEIFVAHIIRIYLGSDAELDDHVDRMALDFSEMYDTAGLGDDLFQGVKRGLVFLDSVEVDDVDLLLQSFIWYLVNYENFSTKRNKSPLFGGLLKGRPKSDQRVFLSTKALKDFAYGLRSGRAPMKPSDWSVDQEEEFSPIFSILYKKDDESEGN
ncbi:MAG: hypothetical protein EB015_15440 [Methylocystaceae bacterium]|nr:hypothetical protein [Methylocystaceae bacterium]